MFQPCSPQSGPVQPSLKPLNSPTGRPSMWMVQRPSNFPEPSRSFFLDFFFFFFFFFVFFFFFFFSFHFLCFSLFSLLFTLSCGAILNCPPNETLLFPPPPLSEGNPYIPPYSPPCIRILSENSDRRGNPGKSWNIGLREMMIRSRHTPAKSRQRAR